MLLLFGEDIDVEKLESQHMGSEPQAQEEGVGGTGVGWFLKEERGVTWVTEK